MFRRVFRGIAHHTDGDFIWISYFIGSPTDLFSDKFDEAEVNKWVSKTFGGSFGGMIGLPQILFDTDLWVGRFCAKWGQSCISPDDECRIRKDGVCQPPRVKFKATVEIERIGALEEISV